MFPDSSDAFTALEIAPSWIQPLPLHRHHSTHRSRKPTSRCAWLTSRRTLCGVLSLVFVIIIGIQLWGLRKNHGTDLTKIHLKKENPISISRRVVHIDLKGMPVKASYLMEIIPFLAQWGATDLLLEWESMLPFFGEYKILRSPDAYTEQEVADIMKVAATNQLSVIPLIDVFGHMEYLLKHRQYAYLREADNDMRTVCPSKTATPKVVRDILDQVLSFHPKSTIIHLGGGEVSRLKECWRCKRLPLSEAELYMYHMLPLIKYVRSRDLRVIIWDDMIRNFPYPQMDVLSNAGVELAVWNYSPSLQGPPVGVLRPALWNSYEGFFQNKLWGVGAFKGADQSDGDFVPLVSRITNIVNWLKLASVNPLNGIILSGNSRFDYQSPLCETLPAGIPALVLCLQVLKQGYYSDSLRNSTFNELHIPADTPMLLADVPDVARVPDASVQYRFPGADVYRFVEHLQSIRILQLAGVQDHVQPNSAISTIANTLVQPTNVQTIKRDLLAAIGLADDGEEQLRLRQGIQELAKDAEAVLPRYFFWNDIHELITTKLGIQLQEAAHLPMQSSSTYSLFGFSIPSLYYIPSFTMGTVAPSPDTPTPEPAVDSSSVSSSQPY
eukprot:TRINITY_DN1651_c0_g1_i1.p1 TRINITY_DN1651_c0_g1~~TRINITY_DN1651_c0_g1_i1.p1  ORF type:complete len:611 (+),score=150.23 TRINITY_DN1651_c0_g1_i1:120-1952(+)